MKKFPAIILTLTLLLSLAACRDDAPEVTEASSGETQSAAIETTGDILTTIAPVTEATAATEVTTVPVTEAPSTAAPVASSKEEILKTLADAVNKTKGYQNAITVNHTESFDIVEPVVSLDSAEMLGNLATRAVNFIKDLVLKPGSEVYNFSGGIATTSEGEKTQLLLPKDRAFSLSADAVANAVISDENGMKHIVITLNPEETHSLSEVPANHANSIGYLDIDGSFKIIQIDELNIKYPGSVIDAMIRADGYVDCVTYTINLNACSKAHGMGVSGSATFSGSQTEVWKINW